MRHPFKALIQHAKQHGYAVPAINVSNYETMMGVFSAASEKASPVIVQVATIQLTAQKMTWPEFMALIELAERRYPEVLYALHLDHATTISMCEEAIAQGFDSVMFDASAKPLQDNINETQQLRHKYPHLSIEAEVGALGAEEGQHHTTHTVTYTQPEDAIQFAKQVDVQGLAVAIGNAHGFYKGEPDLQFDVLKTIHDAIPEVPLVLHGATGLSPEMIRACIQLGMHKVNFFTRCDYAFTQAFCDTIKQGKYMMFAQQAGQKAFQEEAQTVMEICLSEGKAWV